MRSQAARAALSTSAPTPRLAHSAPDRAIRTPDGGDALVPAAIDQRGGHVVEHHPVRDTSAATAPRVNQRELRATALIQ
jgi:hypothetical protein